MNNLTFEKLLTNEKARIIFHTISGSHAYGTNIPTSDKDTMGVFVMDKNHYLTSNEPVKQLSDERNDNRFYALKNFLEMASNANPNILDLLYMPNDCILKTTPYWNILQQNRTLFVSKLACKSYCEYALAQIKKAKGCNKRVHNPQPVEVPVAEDFCKFIPISNNAKLPGRPVDIKSAGINLAHYHVAAVENSSFLYRLYHYGPAAKGVFRNGMLVCESIPLNDEKKLFSGLLLFNKDAFEHAKSQHKQYWTWRQNRNESRWVDQEKGLLDYDAKNMMHTFRLLYSGINIIRNGEPLVRFTGEKLTELMAIRQGKFPYDKLLEKSQILFEELASLRENSTLPETADKEKISNLLLEITNMWEVDHAG
jgi:predicted nucleotidyltransferase